MISTMRPQYTGWHPSLVIPEYRYLSNKLLFATEFGWSGTTAISTNDGYCGILDLISGKRASQTGYQYTQNSYGLSNFGTHFNFSETATTSNGFRFQDSLGLAWWVSGRADIPITIEALVYLDSGADTSNNTIIRMGDGDTSGTITCYLVYNTDHWELFCSRRTAGGGYQRSQQNAEFPVDRWTHVVVTIPAYGFGEIDFYIDSKIPDYSTRSPGAGTIGANTDKQILISSTASAEWQGKMGNVRVYQGLLTQDDVNKLYADPFGILRQSPRGFEWVERRPTIRVRARGRG